MPYSCCQSLSSWISSTGATDLGPCIVYCIRWSNFNLDVVTENEVSIPPNYPWTFVSYPVAMGLPGHVICTCITSSRAIPPPASLPVQIDHSFYVHAYRGLAHNIPRAIRNSYMRSHAKSSEEALILVSTCGFTMLLSGRRGDVNAVASASYDEMNATLTNLNSSLRLACAHKVRSIFMCV